MTTTCDMMRVHILLNGWRFGTSHNGAAVLWRDKMAPCVHTRLAYAKIRGRTKYAMIAEYSSFGCTEKEPKHIPFDEIRALYQFVRKLESRGLG